MNYVKVIATDFQVDKNGREYNRVTLQTMGNETFIDPTTGEIHQVLAPSTTVRAIGYKVPYLYDADDTSAVPDWMYNAKVDMVVQGQIVRRKVSPYTINGDVREYATIFVAGDPQSPAFETAINASFEKAGHTLTDKLHAIPVPTIATRRAIKI